MQPSEEVIEVGRKLGYDDEGIQTVVDRAGSNSVALRRLNRKLAGEERYVERASNERIAKTFAERATARHAKTRIKERARREADRARLTLPGRLALCIEEAATLPCTDGVGVAGGGVSSGKNESHAPTSSPNEGVEWHLVRIRALVASLEREVDTDKYGADAGREGVEERDLRLVRDYEGWPSYEVATFDHSVSSPDTVERARRKHGRRATNGRRMFNDAAA